MYENEFTCALQAMSESMSEEMFDSIIEGASALIEETGMEMDEAVATSAAALFNEDMIDENAFAVTDVVINEFANNRQVSWDEALTVIAESVDENTFNQLMDEGVKDMLAKLKAKGAEKAEAVKDAAVKGGKYAKAAAQVAGGAIGKEAKKVADVAKKPLNAAQAAVKRQVLKNEIKDAYEDTKEAAAKKLDDAKDAVKGAGSKIAEKFSKNEPKNESAMTLGEIRAIVESVSEDPTTEG